MFTHATRVSQRFMLLDDKSLWAWAYVLSHRIDYKLAQRASLHDLVGRHGDPARPHRATLQIHAHDLELPFVSAKHGPDVATPCRSTPA